MDIDEDEVTREPFYNESDDDDEREDEEEDCQVEEQHSQHEASTKTIDEESPQLKSDTESNDDRSVSSICSDDVELAKSYNIRLKEAKSKTAALYESEFIDTKETKGDKLIETSITSDCIHHRGVFLQKGDIVGLCDQDDGQIYFAQLTGFVQDIYCEKSASVNWLVPIRPTSREVFNPADYKVGLEDTRLRKLDSMIFIRHSPIDYYSNGNRFCQSSTSQQLNEFDVDLRQYQKRCQPYIWATMEPCEAPKVELGPKHTQEL